MYAFERQTKKQIDSQAGTAIKRQIDRQTEGHTDRQSDIQRGKSTKWSDREMSFEQKFVLQPVSSLKFPAHNVVTKLVCAKIYF